MVMIQPTAGRMSPGEPLSVSVVVAAAEVNPHLEACLEAYLRESEPSDELLAVVAAEETTCRSLEAARPGVQAVSAPRDSLTPELWSLGIARARSLLVRITTASFVPEPGWRETLVAAHGDGAEAVGGAIRPGTGLRLTDWAVYFLRYRSYLPPFPRHAVTDVPGDHASYRLEALQELRHQWAAGFWEFEINAELARRGRRLVMDPRVSARYQGGERSLRFFRQRIHHGLRFGKARLRGAGTLRRILHAGAFLLPGLVFLGKIVREVRARGAYRRQFVLSLPWLLFFLLAWSLGEWLGSLSGLGTTDASAGRPRLPDP